jgi:hypothetical protein
LSISTTHDRPTTAGRDRAAYWKEAEPYPSFLETVRSYEELWKSTYERALIPLGMLDRVRALRRRWNLLVVSADWCIDAPPVTGPLARLAEDSPALQLRQLDRDCHVDLIDEHLTNGRSRSIPIVILLDDRLVEHAWWGPRPAALQTWWMHEGQHLPSADRYRFSRQWMARDRGQATIEEVISMIERAEEALG